LRIYSFTVMNLANENQTAVIVLLADAFFFFQEQILLLVSNTVFTSSPGFLTVGKIDTKFL
jgi:hypothetical protein